MKWFMNLRVRAKLHLAFAALALITVVAGVNNLRTMGRLQGNVQEVYDHRLNPIAEAANIRGAMLRVRIGMLQHILASDAAKMREFEEQIRTFDAVVDEELRKYAAHPLAPEEAQAVAGFRKQWAEFKDGRNGQTLPLSAAGKKSEAIAVALGPVGQRFADASRAIDDVVAVNMRMGETLLRAGQQEYASARWLTGAFVIAGAVLSVLLGFMLARMLARPLGEAVDVLEAVAMGDFTRRLDVDTRDETGQMARALDEAVSAMRSALLEVSASADQAAAASAELSAAGEQMASGAQEQAASLEETAAALEEITATVKQNADNARQADQLARGSRDVAEKGGALVASAVTAMAEINEASRKIAAIITTIDEIAFQTNLLALNAAVEAARAGEQGRGFAVVATEVRSLAQRSATAAREIKALIQDSVAKVECGSTLVTRSGQTLGEIVASVKRVTDIIGEIAAASGEQSTGIGQVNRAVTQMDQVTQTNAAQTEELSSTAQGLAAQARQLQHLVGRFHLGRDGGRTATTAIRSSARVAPTVERRTVAPPATRQPAGRAEPVLVAAGTSNGRAPHHGVDDGFEEF